MTILRYSRIPEDPFSGDANSNFQFTERYNVISDNYTDAWPEVLAFEPNWYPGKIHLDQPKFRVSRFACDRNNASRSLTAEVEYSYLKHDDPNPLLRPAIFSMSPIREQVPMILDVDGNPIRTKDGSLIDGLTRYQTRWGFKFTKNIPLSYPSFIVTHADAINEADYEIKGLLNPKQTLQITGMNVEESPDFVEKVDGEDVRYSKLSITIEQDRKTFLGKRANASLWEKVVIPSRVDDGTEVPERFERRRILNDDKSPIDQPHWLDENGQALRNEDGTLRTENIDPTELLEIEFKQYEEKSFTVLDDYLR